MLPPPPPQSLTAAPAAACGAHTQSLPCPHRHPLPVSPTPSETHVQAKAHAQAQPQIVQQLPRATHGDDFPLDASAARLLCVAGKVVLVTGASSGIGRVMAKCLALHGCHVAAAARRTRQLDALVAEVDALRAQRSVGSTNSSGGGSVVCGGSRSSPRSSGCVCVADKSTGGGEAAVHVHAEVEVEVGRMVGVALDVSAAESEVDAAVGRVWDHFGRIDVVVNNAGVRGPKASVVDITDDDFTRAMMVNVRGPWLVTKAVARRFIAARRPNAPPHTVHSGVPNPEPHHDDMTPHANGDANPHHAMARAHAGTNGSEPSSAFPHPPTPSQGSNLQEAKRPSQSQQQAQPRPHIDSGIGTESGSGSGSGPGSGWAPRSGQDAGLVEAIGSAVGSSVGTVVGASVGDALRSGFASTLASTVGGTLGSTLGGTLAARIAGATSAALGSAASATALGSTVGRGRVEAAAPEEGVPVQGPATEASGPAAAKAAARAGAEVTAAAEAAAPAAAEAAAPAAAEAAAPAAAEGGQAGTMDGATVSVVNVASTAGMEGGLLPNGAAYSASKAALIRLTKAMAIELGPHGIRCNCIAPGLFDSDITHGLFRKPWLQRNANVVVPMQRWGEAHPDLTAMLLLLASDASYYVTGACIPVDGGHSLMRMRLNPRL